MSLKKNVKNCLASFYYNFYKRFQNEVGNRTILYHSIGTELEHDTYGISISKERFKEHILYLKDNYELIFIDDKFSNNLDRNTLSITFDDGYKDNLYALELCEKYKIPFTLYITTNEIGNKNYLNKSEILEFEKSEYCILGTHSHTHPHLASLNYEAQFRELSNSKKILEDILSKEITHMSYPHGSYNEDTLEILDELRYNIVSSSHIGLNNINNLDLKRIKRIEIVSSDTISDLDKKIKGYYDYLCLKENTI